MFLKDNTDASQESQPKSDSANHQIHEYKQFQIKNQYGFRLIIAQDGIFVESQGRIKKYIFPEEFSLSPQWFKDKNPNKASVSISGNFVYLIDRTQEALYLFTLTSQSIFCDKLESRIVFVDADFSYEETRLFALTDHNTFILFSVLPPKRLREYSFHWDFIATSFQLGEPNRFFLIKSENDESKKVEKCFRQIPENYNSNNLNYTLEDLTLQPVDKNLGSIFNPYKEPKDKITKQKTSKNPHKPASMTELSRLICERGVQLKDFQEELDNRMAEVENQIEQQKQIEEDLIDQFKQVEGTMASLFYRIQQLIERVDNGENLWDLHQRHQQAQKKVERHNLSSIEPSADIIYELRILYARYREICSHVASLSDQDE